MGSAGGSSFAGVAELVRERTGLVFPESRLGDAEQATRRAMERAGIDDPAAYRAALASGDAGIDDLVAALTVHETYFLRDPAHFAFLREVALPAIAQRRPPGHVVRVWSAGCATGEEAYSLAIVLDEAGLARRSYVLGTDLSSAAIARARRGRYRAWALRGAEQGRARRWLTPEGDELVLAESLRRRVSFAAHNLAETSYPSLRSGIGAFDIVFCRNVLVYLDRGAVRGVARRLFESLAPGGFLFTAGTDPSLGADAPFEVLVTGGGLVYQRPAPAAAYDVRPSSASVEDAPPAGGPLPSSLPPPPDSAAAPANDRLAAARASFASGDWTAAASASAAEDDPELSVIRVRAAANLGEAALAAQRCEEALSRHPLSVELHYLRALLAIELGRFEDAAAAARRVTYLDPSSAPGFFVLGLALQRMGDAEGAARAYRNAQSLAGSRPPCEAVPLGEGDSAGALAAAAAAALLRLDSPARAS